MNEIRTCFLNKLLLFNVKKFCIFFSRNPLLTQQKKTNQHTKKIFISLIMKLYSKYIYNEKVINNFFLMLVSLMELLFKSTLICFKKL